MRRFSKYIVTALITFTLGLVFSFWFSSKQTQTIRPAPLVDVETRNPDRVTSMVGHGVTSDGFETHLFEYQYADGTFVNQLSVFYGSPERATAELQKRLEQASQVIRREPMLDEKQRRIGERVVATFPPQNVSGASSAELLWTEYGRFVIQKRSSVKNILDELDRKR